MLTSKADISAVIFDMDGLMFDTERIAIEAWQLAGHACNCEIPDSLVIQSFGLNIHDTRMLFEQSLGSSLDFDRIRALRVQYAADIIEQRGVPLKDGLLELLDVLTSHAVLKAVATSTERTRAKHLLRKGQVSTRFDVLVCGDDVRQGKPAPDIFLLSASRLQVTPRQCLVLEDSESGIHAAENADMRRFMIPDIKPPSKEILAVVDQVFPDLHAVATYLSDVFTAD
jgi:HAD superfamily hydrolase (TIGR01509 family)